LEELGSTVLNKFIKAISRSKPRDKYGMGKIFNHGLVKLKNSKQRKGAVLAAIPFPRNQTLVIATTLNQHHMLTDILLLLIATPENTLHQSQI